MSTDLRHSLAATARALVAEGLTGGTSGNVSVRHGRDVLITPTGLALDACTSDTSVVIDLAGGQVAGTLKPSSEWPLHTALYRARPEVQAIVHLHPPHATAVACLRRSIPPFHYMVAVTGRSSIPCAPSATYGTAALAESVVAAMSDGWACLLANHGLLTAGTSLGHARRIAGEVETLAKQYLLACSAGEPVLLSEAEMARVIERFATYGQRSGVGQEPPQGTT